MPPHHILYVNSRENKIREANFADHVKKLLDEQVSAYAIQSFEKFEKFHGKVRIVPSNNSKSLHEGRNNPVGFTEYCIEMTSRPAQESKVRIKNVQLELLHSGTWSTLTTILDSMPTSTAWEALSAPWSVATKLALLEKQWQWYYHNGKKFHFLCLPSEIRELIYHELYPRTFQPFPYCLSRRRIWATSAGISADQGNASLLRVNRQLHNEASHILFRDTTFLLEQPSILNRVLRHTPALSQNLKRLDFSLPHKQYLKLFGFSLYSFADYPPKPAAHALRNLDLKLLTLRIAEPDWYNNSFNNRIPFCQRKVVKHILRAAYAFVKGHPVAIVGCVLKKQKERFERVMGEWRREFEEWRAIGTGEESLREWDEDEGGVDLGDEDEGDGKEGVRREREWPPVCACSVHCGRVSWGVE